MFDPQGRLAGIGTHYFRDEAGQPSRIVIVDAIREFLAEPACFQLLPRLRGQILEQGLTTIGNSAPIVIRPTAPASATSATR
jgi:hypothetical protein